MSMRNCIGFAATKKIVLDRRACGKVRSNKQEKDRLIQQHESGLAFLKPCEGPHGYLYGIRGMTPRTGTSPKASKKLRPQHNSDFRQRKNGRGSVGHVGGTYERHFGFRETIPPPGQA